MKAWKAGGLLLLLLGLTASAFAGNLSGNVSGVLRFENSPYSVVGPITVPSDSQLVIEPGVDLRFAQGAALIVRGRLIVMGTISQRVIFQGGDGQTWNGIRFEDGLPEVSTLSNVEIRNSSNPVFVDMSNVVIDSSLIYGSNKGLFVTRSTVLLSNSLLVMTITQLEPGVGVDAIDSDIQVMRDTILVNSSGVCENVTGISVQQGTATLSSNVIQVNSNSAFVTCGIYLLSQDDALVSRNIVKVTSLLFSCGMKLENSGAGVYIHNNSVRLMSQNTSSYGLMIEDGRSINIRNNVVWGNNFGWGIV
ncbi:MAG: right-handed parallel beta-helix repeat-containing protein, partial [bacterium]|nr:right-handed parallel beta-helix repeat-containing protein [bacterium]